MPKKVKKPEEKLTKEEKKLRKLARREAAKLNRIEKEKKAQKDFLAREVRYTEQNIKKITEKWREIMKKVRAPDLYEDVVSMRRSLDHQFDIKDSIIEMLVQMLEESEEQYSMNLCHHVETMNKLFGVYNLRIDEMNTWYRNNLEVLAEELLQFRNDYVAAKSKHYLHLRMIMFSMEERAEERAMILKAETTARVDEEDAKSGGKLQEVRASLERQQESQWTCLQNTLNDHLEKTAERRKAVATLSAVDKQGATVVQKQRELTHRTYEAIQKLSRTIALFENPASTPLLNERNTLKSAQNFLRKMFERGRSRDNTQLQHLVIASDNALQTLKSLEKMGERIIRLANLCRRLETEDEKILPFPDWAYGKGDDKGKYEGFDHIDSECDIDSTSTDTDPPQDFCCSQEFYDPRDFSGPLDRAGATVGLCTQRAVGFHSECISDDHPEPSIGNGARDEVVVPCGRQDVGVEFGKDGETPGECCCCVPDKTDDTCIPLCRKPSKHNLKEIKRRACELSPAVSLAKTRQALKFLEPLWARVGRANVDIIDLGDLLNHLRYENAALKAQLMYYVRMRAPPFSSSEVQPREPPCIPVLEPPPGFPPRNKFKLLPPVETRL